MTRLAPKFPRNDVIPIVSISSRRRSIGVTGWLADTMNGMLSAGAATPSWLTAVTRSVCMPSPVTSTEVLNGDTVPVAVPSVIGAATPWSTVIDTVTGAPPLVSTVPATGRSTVPSGSTTTQLTAGLVMVRLGATAGWVGGGCAGGGASVTLMLTVAVVWVTASGAAATAISL